MNLEFGQALSNLTNAFRGNTSASNSEQQQAIDAKEVVKRGAVKAAAGQELGLSEEETLRAISRQNRRQSQREAYRSRQQREREWAQKQKTLADEGFKVADPDTDFLDPDVAAAFGQDQSDYYEYEPGDTQYIGQQVEKARQSRAEMELRDELDQRLSTRYGVTLRDERDRRDYEDLGRFIDENTPDYEAFAPQGAGTRDARKRIEAAVLAQVTGAADVAGRLDDDLGPNREAERALVRDLVTQDAQLVNPEMVEYRQNLADAEAQSLARSYFTAGGSGALADESIGRIAEIRKLGTTGEMAQVITNQAAGDFQNAIVVDGTWRNPETMEPLALQGPQRPEVFQGSNTPNTGQVLNVPQGQNATSWLRSNVPEYREGVRTFGDFPQTDIIGTATNLANKIKEQGVLGVPDQIRSIEEFQQAIDVIGGQMAQSGEQAFRFNPETGKNEPSTAFGAEELMTKLRMSGPERAATANMLYQTTVARGTEINQNAKTAYLTRTAAPAADVVFNAPEALMGQSGAAQVAMIPPGTNVTTGTTPAGKPIRQTIVGQLRQMAEAGASPEVTIPFMGAVVDPSTGNMETDAGPGFLTRFKRGGMGSGEELENAILQQARKRAGRKPVDMARVRDTQTKARLVEERQARTDRLRQARQEQIRRYTPANLRQAGRYA